ncbi:magnesium transporter [Bacillus sp. FJAT-27231]|uniref:magnesium transporter n=1 Tax=Bacillus sp. FJAT-27231 TaxID=1679168 RepID=UPI0006708254|nr:magnesium transporter [Bacillus sp. FJAT-27231]KMY55217.1 magnesium transporter [Bacillus sp. FJAT-27231]
MKKIQEDALFVIEKLKEEKYDKINEMFTTKKPYDLASIFQNLPEKHRASMLEHLNEASIASMLPKFNQLKQLELLGKIGPARANKVLALLDTDILSSLLRHFPKADLDRFLSEINDTEAQYLKQMMSYERDTAGSMMTNRYLSVQLEDTVAAAVEKARVHAMYSEILFIIYVLDKNNRLAGTVSYRDLVIAQPDDLVKDIMLKQIISVPYTAKRAEINKLLKRYDFTAIPVLDDQERLLGVITFDDMMQIVIQEANEDIGKLSAVNKEIDFDTKPVTAAKRRLPWLIALLFIGLVSGSIIARFEDTLEKVVALAFFMPLIAGMTGNTGTQSLAVVVRGLAEQEINPKVVTRLIFREFRVSLIIGVTCGLLISLIAFIWQGNMHLGIVVGSSLLLTLILGTLAGTIVPLVLYKFNLDPAVASGPLITTINDIFSLVVYFSIASFFLSRLI